MIQLFGTIPLGPIEGLGPLGFQGETTAEGAPALFASTLSKIIGILTVVAIIWFVFQVIFGAYGWLSAGGDPKKVEEARGKITNAVIGLVIVFFALILASVIGWLLGIDSVLDIQEFIENINEA